MYGSNPNRSNRAMQPTNYANQSYNYDPQNPGKFGMQRLQGRGAVQPNMPGMPTNTLPPRVRPVPQPMTRPAYQMYRRPVGY